MHEEGMIHLRSNRKRGIETLKPLLSNNINTSCRPHFARLKLRMKPWVWGLGGRVRGRWRLAGLFPELMWQVKSNFRCRHEWRRWHTICGRTRGLRQCWWLCSHMSSYFSLSFLIMTTKFTVCRKFSNRTEILILVYSKLGLVGHSLFVRWCCDPGEVKWNQRTSKVCHPPAYFHWSSSFTLLKCSRYVSITCANSGQKTAALCACIACHLVHSWFSYIWRPVITK